MQQLITLLKQLLATNPKDRYIKGHAKDLLTRLQALNPQDDIEICRKCEEVHTDGIFHQCPDNN